MQSPSNCPNVGGGAGRKAGTGEGMGIGLLGDDEIVFKRKFRWTFEVELADCGTRTRLVPAHFVKVAARPNISIEEVEINFLNEKTWIPGKAAWETITVTYIDVAGNDASKRVKQGTEALYSWLASVYDFTNETCRHQGSKVKDYSGEGILFLYDGCGQNVEKWTLKNMWPTAINFGDLDYSVSDTVDIELTLRYSKVSYESFCPKADIKNCCTPCT